MSEITVTIPLKEYNNLKKQEAAINKREIIWAKYGDHTWYYMPEKPSEIVKHLCDEIRNYERIIRELKSQTKNKKWYQFWKK